MRNSALSSIWPRSKSSTTTSDGREDLRMTTTETVATEVRSRPQQSNGLSPGLVDDLKALLGQRFSTAQAVRDQHGVGESYHAAVAPDAVCFAESTEDVAAIVKACA